MLSTLNIPIQMRPEHGEGEILECLETSILTKQEPEKEQRRWESVPENKDSSPTLAARKALDIACSPPSSVPKDSIPSVARRRTSNSIILPLTSLDISNHSKDSISGSNFFPGKEDSGPSDEAPRRTNISTPPSVPKDIRPPLLRMSGSLGAVNAKDSAPIMATRRTSYSN
jgi:hypothetical protein